MRTTFDALGPFMPVLGIPAAPVADDEPVRRRYRTVFVSGPLEVLGRRSENGCGMGGAMHEDLQQACFAALAVPRHEARARALDFSWVHATELFASHLVSARPSDGRTGPKPRLPVTQSHRWQTDR